MEEAIRKRISARGWLTRVERQLRDVIDKSEERFSVCELNDAIGEFEKRLFILDEAQAIVETLIDVEILEEDIENAATFREEKRIVLVKAKDLLFKIQEKKVLPVPTSEISGGVNTRLPQLELPKFSGDYTTWQTFWEKFEACVDSTNIPEINKFTYLQSVLEGEASVSIRGLSLTSENYSIAKEILKKRFGRTERIIFGHIQNLLKVSSKLADGSTMSLWKIHDDIQINVRSLQNLGVSGETYGVILTPLILHQLPANIRLEWARVGEEREGDLDFLLDFLHGEIRRRERSQTFNSLSQQEKPSDVRRTRPSATSLFADGGNRTSDYKKHSPAAKSNLWKSCVFCHCEHFSDQCYLIKNMSFDERKSKIRNAGLCFRCLQKGHLSEVCTKKCYFCKGDHHSVLCKSRISTHKDGNEQNNQTQTASAASQGVQSPHQGVSYSNTGKRTTLMQVVKMKVDGVELRLLFDSGSDRSFVEASVARKLNLNQIGSEDLSYSCFGEQPDRKRKQKPMKLFEFDHNGIKMQLLEIPNICSPMHRASVPSDVLLPFEVIPFNEDYCEGQNVKIDILIGLDHYWEIVSQNVKTSKGLVAQETKFGWMLSGFWDNNNMTMSTKNCLSMHCTTEISEDLIRQMWDLDSVGVTDGDRSKVEYEYESENPDKIVQNFRRDIRLSMGRYEVKLPWKSEEHKKALMNNESQARKRLENLSKKMNMNQDLRERYDAVLSDLENEGIIHEIPMTEMETDNPVFYLPHRPVVKEESVSTKIRPVFDASAKGMNGVSLNDCLDAGPNLLPDLVQVLIRFRRHRYAFVGDIKKAFLQIKLNRTEQDVHRFLWDMNGVTRHMRFGRVSFGVNSSPFLLNATIKYHLEQFDKSKVVEELRDNLYMDDFLSGADSETEMQKLITDADNIMTQGGFTLTKWGSNGSCMPQNVVKNLEGSLTEIVPTRKILGVAWNMKEDSFCFETLKFELNTPITKRLLLSLVARIFDPLGLLTPYTITLKILFQDAWKIGVEWDQSLPLKIQKEILKWISDLRDLQLWKIPRRVIEAETWQDAKTIELISFSDASEKAYGCCIYLKTTHGDPTVTTSRLVISKVKVAPLKRITLPRLELMAALLSARLLKFVHTALKLEDRCPYMCYSDSQITLHWIKGDPLRWKQFVSNRVAEIQDLTNSARWNHCRSKDNPADLLTRGVDAETLSNSSLWLRGPPWLVEHPEEKDGEENEDLESLTEDLNLSEQLEIEQRKAAATFVVNETNVNIFSKLDKFGKWEKLVRVCGWILRFIKNCRSKVSNRSRDLTDHIKTDEINSATERIILNLQRATYPDEFKDLESKGIVDAKSSIFNLSPFIGKDGLLRVRGRLDFAPGLFYDEKHPIILPKCQTPSLIVQAQHEIMKHAGVNTLITALRNKFWIVGVRTLAKKICRRCVRCRRQDSRPLDQVTAPLPKDRLTKSPPFHVTGVDHAGPLYCRDRDNKLYILIFTCAVTRAVHLELVESLSLNDFLMAFRRFSSRRGLPTILYSDNASTFKGADQYIQKHFKQAKITWRFNAPRAPWWGGWWERLIRSVKSGLRKSLGTEQVSRTELETTLQEVECCVNSRPLTYVEETKQPLTPSHFLIGRATPCMSAEPIEFSPEVMDLRNRDIAERRAIDKFWALWRDDYMRNLPPLRQKSAKLDLGVRVGSVVMIKNEDKSRLLWPLGVVTKLYTGRDGYIRAAQLKTANGFIDRPVQNLYRLELEVDGEDAEFVDEDAFPSGDDEKKRSSEAHSHSQARMESKEILSRRGRVIKPRKIIDV